MNPCHTHIFIIDSRGWLFSYVFCSLKSFWYALEWSWIFVVAGIVYICVQSIYTRIPHTIFWLISSQIFPVYHFSDANTVSHSPASASSSLATNRKFRNGMRSEKKIKHFFVYIYIYACCYFFSFSSGVLQFNKHLIKLFSFFSLALSCQSISAMRKMYALSLSRSIASVSN